MTKIRAMSGFIHPFHLNKNHLVGEMSAPGIVEVEGDKYMLSPNTFYTEERVHLFLIQDRYETETEYNMRLEREKAAGNEILKRLEALEKEQLKQQERDLQKFKNTYNIPFKSSVRIKPVLSGLSANSNGDGAKCNTVMHLFVEEPFNGRIKREANTFLCSPSDNGKWSNLDDYTYNSPVTCKKCLQLMNRWLVVE